MNFLSEFYKSIDDMEKASENKISNKKVDYSYLLKGLLMWLVGGVVSLMPTVTDIYIHMESKNNFLKEFFSNKDLFLVITTLTISVLLELIFSENSNYLNYIVTSIGIVLTVFSIYIYSLLQSKINIPSISYIGIIVLICCIIASLIGYANSSRK